MMSMMKSLRQVLTMFAVCLALGPASVEGQGISPWAPGFEQPLKSTIQPWVIERLLSDVVLSEAQQQAVQGLFEEHTRQFATFAEDSKKLRAKLDQAIADARAAEDGHAVIAARLDREEKLGEVADEQRAIDKRFMASVERILAEEQMADWREFVLWLNRAKWLRQAGRYAEGSVDLIKLLDELAEEGDQAGRNPGDIELSAVLIEYANRLDEAVRAVAEFFIKRERTTEAARNWQTDGAAVWSEGIIDMRADGRQRRRLLTLLRAVRNVNRQYREVIARLIDDDLLLPFETRYFAMATHGWIREDRLEADRTFDAVQSLESLTDDHREAIEAMHLIYQESLKSVRRAIIRGIDDDLEARYTKGTDPAEVDAIRAQLEADLERRREMDRTFVREVWALLTPQQQGELVVPEAVKRRKVDDNGREVASVDA